MGVKVVEPELLLLEGQPENKSSNMYSDNSE